MALLENKLAKIQELTRAEELRLYFADSNNIVVSNAIARVIKLKNVELGGEISNVLERLLNAKDPIKADKGCRAKIICVKGLKAFDELHRNYDLLKRALNHRQLEPVYGGHEDTGADLRSEVATAIAALPFPEVTADVAPLLFDQCVLPQTAAIKAFVHVASEAAITALRVKAAADSATDEVTEELFAAILKIDHEPIDFLKRFLYNDCTEISRKNALFALGKFKGTEAFNALNDFYYYNSDLFLRKQILLAISITGTDEGYELLKRCLAEGGSVAEYAATVIGVYLNDETRRDEVKKVLREVGSEKIIEIVSSNLYP